MGRKKAISGLPEPIPGEPFSLIGTLRRCTSTLTVQDVAKILVMTEQAVYAAMDDGKIPEAFTPFGVRRIDPAAWVLILEHDNKHLLPSVRKLSKAA